MPVADLEIAARPPPQQGESLKLAGLAEKLNLSLEDKKKVREVEASSLPVSHYTPPAEPSYLEDYFSDDIIPVETGTLDVPRSVIGADGSEVQLQDEVKIFFGMMEAPPAGSAPPARVPGRPVARVTSAVPRASSVTRGRPTIVHFVAGGTKRGQIEDFDPAADRFLLIPRKSDAAPEEILMQAVLAIFFGIERGQPATEAAGDRVVVTLINDKRVGGVTADYQEGGDSLTIVPDPKRGNIDRIWVPASAVKSIEVA